MAKHPSKLKGVAKHPPNTTTMAAKHPPLRTSVSEVAMDLPNDLSNQGDDVEDEAKAGSKDKVTVTVDA